MKGSQKIILSLVTALSLFAGAPAFADNGRGNNGNGWGRDDNRGRNDTYIYRNYDHQDNRRYNDPRNTGRPQTVRIYDNDRIILNQYVTERYHTAYPRGWSRNYSPPRRYIIGYPLPRDVVYYSVPYEVRSHMRPVPVGYQYVRVDNDVLLMNAATKQIIDAVSLLSAIGQR